MKVGRKYTRCCLDRSGPPKRDEIPVSEEEMRRMVVQQAGHSTEHEFESALRRFELHCEKLPEGRQAPSCVEFMGREQAATDGRRQLKDALAGQGSEMRLTSTGNLRRSAWRERPRDHSYRTTAVFQSLFQWKLP